MDKEKIIEQAIKLLKARGVSCQELAEYLLRKGIIPRGLAYEIVYADDTISIEHIAGKEIKGVIFVLEDRRVFVSAKYSSQKMKKLESSQYCASVKVKGKSCSEGDVKHWKKGGILYRYRERINEVMKRLGLEKIYDKIIWTSTCDGLSRFGTIYRSVCPMTGRDSCSYVCGDEHDARPVCFFD